MRAASTIRGDRSRARAALAADGAAFAAAGDAGIEPIGIDASAAYESVPLNAIGVSPAGTVSGSCRLI